MYENYSLTIYNIFSKILEFTVEFFLGKIFENSGKGVIFIHLFV
jgi:hypothetical protein